MAVQLKSSLGAIARTVVAVCICLLLTLSHVMPAFAASASEGADSLPRVQNKSEKVLKEEPRGHNQVQAQARKGINEVQGSADADRMNRPDNSQQVTSIEEKVREGLSNITN